MSSIPPSHPRLIVDPKFASSSTPRVRPLSEYRSLAQRLIKDFRSSDGDRAVAAARRLARLRSFGDFDLRALLEQPDQVRLKHALAVIATEEGFDSWLDLKRESEARSMPTADAYSRRETAGTAMYEGSMGVLLNRWFAAYEPARESRQERGGFLLPYKSQFFVCEEEGIRLLGLDPEDPDWAAIGFDWVDPADSDAWQRLMKARRRAL